MNRYLKYRASKNKIYIKSLELVYFQMFFVNHYAISRIELFSSLITSFVILKWLEDVFIMNAAKLSRMIGLENKRWINGLAQTD